MVQNIPWSFGVSLQLHRFNQTVQNGAGKVLERWFSMVVVSPPQGSVRKLWERSWTVSVTRKGHCWHSVDKGQGCDMSCNKQDSLTLWQIALYPTGPSNAPLDIHVGEKPVNNCLSPETNPVLYMYKQKSLFLHLPWIFHPCLYHSVQGKIELGCVRDKVENYVTHDNAINRVWVATQHSQISWHQ